MPALVPRRPRVRRALGVPLPKTETQDTSGTTDVFDIENAGVGTQITTIGFDHVEWTFEALSLFRIKTYLDGALTVTAEIDSSYFPTETVVQVGDVYTITWTKAGETTTVVYVVTVDETAGTISVYPSQVTIDPTVFVSKSIWSIETQFAVRSYDPANVENMTVMLPAFGGLLYRNATEDNSIAGEEPVADYPGFMQDTEPLEGRGGLAAYQMVCAWDNDANAAIAFRRNDTTARGARMRYNGTTTGVRFRFELLPPNNLVTTAYTGSAADSIIIHPMRGHWYECCKWYRERVQAEAMPFIARGKIADMAGAVGDISSDFLEVDCLLWMAPGNAFPPSLQTIDSAVWGRCTVECDRVVSYFGGDLRYMIQWYHWHDNAFGDYIFQDILPPLSPFLSAVTNLSDPTDPFVHVLYQIPTWVGTSSTWYSANTASAFVALNSGQTHILSDEGFNSVNQFGHTACRTALTDTYDDLPSGFTSLGGFYLDDVVSTGPRSDYRSTLTDAQKGPGSTFYMSGKITWLDSLRTTFKVTQAIPQFTMVGEFASETLVPYIDSMGGLNHDLPNLDVFMPAFRTIYSEYVRGISYSDMLGPFDIFSTFSWDTISLTLERSFHFGNISALSFNGFTSKLHLVATSEETGYDAIYIPYQKRVLDFLKALARASRDYQVKLYQRGRRLKPLRGLWEDTIMRRGYEVVAGKAVPEGINTLVVARADVQGSVWQTDELSGSPIAILLTNHHVNDRECYLEMREQDYPEKENRTFLVERSGLTRTLYRSNVRDFGEHITVPGLGFRMFELLSTAP